MASSFLLLTPDVPAQALAVTPSVAFDPDYPPAALATGARANHARLAANGSAVSLTYDLGTGNTRQVDHLVLGGVRGLRAGGASECRLQGSSNGTTWVNQLGVPASFSAVAGYGPDGLDVLFAPGVNDAFAATLAAYRYWRLTLSGPSAQTFPLSKLFFGAALDLGKEPDGYELEVVPESEETWTYPRGQVLMAKSGPARHQVTVEWDGLTDANAQAFEQRVVRPAARDTLYLWTTTWLDPLYDNRLMHVKLDPTQTRLTRKRGAGDWNDLSAVFVEEP